MPGASRPVRAPPRDPIALDLRTEIRNLALPMISPGSRRPTAPRGRDRGPWLGPAAVLWVALAAIAVPAAALGMDLFAATGLVAGSFCLARERRRIVHDPVADPRRERARELPLCAGEVFFAAAAALAVAFSDITAGRAAAAPWLAWIAAFSVAVQGYTDIVFARAVRGTGLAVPRPLGARRRDGGSVGFGDPLPLWAVLARAPVAALAPALALYLILGRPLALLTAVGVWFAGGLVFVSIVCGVVMWRLEAGARAEPRAPHKPLGGRARWQRLRAGLEAANDDAFWGLVVARPLAAVVLYPFADGSWLTPNRVTVVSIGLCLLAGAIGAFGDPSLVALVVALIFCRSVLDSVDGQLARYRGLSSHFGGYFDKVSDAFGWAALYVAAAASGFAATGAAWALVVPLAGVTALSFQGITYWLDRDLRLSAAPTASPGGRPPLSLAGWLHNLRRIVHFEEPDYYLWISLALITGWWLELAWLIGLTYSLRVIALSTRRLVHARSVWMS